LTKLKILEKIINRLAKVFIWNIKSMMGKIWTKY